MKIAQFLLSGNPVIELPEIQSVSSFWLMVIIFFMIVSTIGYATMFDENPLISTVFAIILVCAFAVFMFSLKIPDSERERVSEDISKQVERAYGIKDPEPVLDFNLLNSYSLREVKYSGDGKKMVAEAKKITRNNYVLEDVSVKE